MLEQEHPSLLEQDCKLEEHRNHMVLGEEQGERDGEDGMTPDVHLPSGRTLSDWLGQLAGTSLVEGHALQQQLADIADSSMDNSDEDSNSEFSDVDVQCITMSRTRTGSYVMRVITKLTL